MAINKLELQWIGKDKPINCEKRLLIEDQSKSFSAESNSLFQSGIYDNLLIHGDNLLALNALLKDYSGQVKCVYIDPPYNTGYAFDDYDDNLEHSIWLNLMHERLVLLHKLLKDDGVIVVQIGFDEMAYLKVLMDEVFGRDKCLGQIAVRMSHSAGMKRKAMDKCYIKNTEYILVYYKKTAPVIKPIYEMCYDYPVNYYQYILDFPTNDKPGTFCGLIDILYTKFKKYFDKYELAKNNKSIDFLFKNCPEVYDYVIANKSRICRKDSNVPNVDGIDASSLVKEDVFVRFISVSGAEEYFIGKNSAGNYFQIYSLEDKVKKVEYVNEDGSVGEREAITNLIGDWWDNFYKDMSRVDIEGGVKMKASKKPERLIKWVFGSLTNPGDLVLDSFLGSGTTCAVAHKMGRKWIGIEMGDHCYTLAKVRLDNVISGKDKTGITSAMNWCGGGGYKFYELAPSLIIKDAFDEPVINKEYHPELLASAVALHEGFTFSPDRDVFWKQSKSNENAYLFVTTIYLTVEMLKEIESQMSEDEYLVIACKAFDKTCKDFSRKITIKKIPQMLLGKCEFGKDDYSLNIVNPPIYEEEDDNE